MEINVLLNSLLKLRMLLLRYIDEAYEQINQTMLLEIQKIAKLLLLIANLPMPCSIIKLMRFRKNRSVKEKTILNKLEYLRFIIYGLVFITIKKEPAYVFCIL